MGFGVSGCLAARRACLIYICHFILINVHVNQWCCNLKRKNSRDVHDFVFCLSIQTRNVKQKQMDKTIKVQQSLYLADAKENLPIKDAKTVAI